MNKYDLLYENKFIDPNVAKITDSKETDYKNYQNKLKNLQKEELEYNKIIDIDNERATKERISILNIDSRDRRINPKNIYSNISYQLDNDPFEFKLSSNKIKISCKNHNFKLNDKISINNVIGRNVKLNHVIYLKKDSYYAKIYDNKHNLTYEYHNKNILVELSNVKGNINNNNIVSSNGLSNNLLSNVKFRITNNSSNYLAGIPINLFNKRHNILLNVLEEKDPMNDDVDIINLKNDIEKINNIDLSELSDLSSLEIKLENILINNINPLDNTVTNLKNIINRLTPNFFLIKLPRKAKEDYIPDSINKVNIENFNTQINYHNLFGLNLNLFNADYPLNVNRKKGSHLISKIINENSFEICIDGLPLEPQILEDSNQYFAGGSCIEIIKINNIFDGYPNPNFYKIFLKKTFYNVKRIELISTTFPNTENVFKNKNNNKLYWNILDDGEDIKSLEITTGNYTLNTLEEEIKNKAFNIKRQFVIPQSLINNEYKIELEEIMKDPNNVFDLCWSPKFCSEFKDIEKGTILIPNINIITSEVSFSMYEKIYLKKCIGGFDIQTSSFVVVQPSHPYNNDDENIVIIEINGSTDITENNKTYPASKINTSHKILKIIDKDRYRVEFDSTYILPIIRPENNGGNNISITYPIKFRMLFDKEDTMGKELGFNYVSEENSVTPFSYTINNYNLYENEQNYNSIGIEIERKNLFLSFTGNNYILMTNEILTNFQNTGVVNNIFAKIQLQDLPGTYLYNTFVYFPKIFEDPLTQLSELEFKFYNYDGSLYDFNGANHSFCLKITELINLPTNSHINARTGAKLQTFSNESLLTY